eukprot:GHRR01005166.1.p1 GENE.GHRR01005166.1~~GHRR01005166.1.p1  ORF type:complete len:179 (+),score=52.24 GHRR01005166.1:113-649(+)
MLAEIRSEATTPVNCIQPLCARRGLQLVISRLLHNTARMQVLSAQENLHVMEPPAKQPRLQQQQQSRFVVKLLNSDAVVPKRGSQHAAGYDLSSAEHCVIPARGKLAVHTGLAIHVPSGTYGRVAPRSGLAAKHFIDVGAGVIDEDYRGEVLVLLFNHSDNDFEGQLQFAAVAALLSV